MLLLAFILTPRYLKLFTCSSVYWPILRFCLLTKRLVIIIYFVFSSLIFSPILWLASINLYMLVGSYTQLFPWTCYLSYLLSLVLMPSFTVCLHVSSLFLLRNFWTFLPDNDERTWHIVFSLQLLINLTSFEGIPKFISIVQS